MNPTSQRSQVKVNLKPSDRVQIEDVEINEEQFFDALRYRYINGTSLSKQKTLVLRTNYKVPGLTRVLKLKIRLTAITDRGPIDTMRCFGFEAEVVHGSHFIGDTPRGEILKVEGYLIPDAGLGTFWVI